MYKQQKFKKTYAEQQQRTFLGIAWLAVHGFLSSLLVEVLEKNPGTLYNDSIYLEIISGIIY